MEFGEQFLLKFRSDDSEVQSMLTNIINQAQSGVTVGIAMDADTTKVIKKIEQISALMKQKIGEGVFDFNELFNFKSAVSELGVLSGKFDQLVPIFKVYNDMANNLTASMTQLASLKLDAGQFIELKTTLESIDTSIQNIGNKLDGVGSNSGTQKVAKEAKEAAEEMDKAARATEELGKKQKELSSADRADTVANTDGGNQQNSQSGVLGLSESSLQTIIGLFEKMEASLASMKEVFVDVGDGEEFSPLLSMINKVEKSIRDLGVASDGLKMDVNLGLGSLTNERSGQKIAQATMRQLEAYRKLFAAMKSTGKTNEEMFRFFEPEDASVAEIIGAYKGVIARAEKQHGKDTYKKLIGRDYANYIKEVENATAQFNRATNTQNDNSPLGDLFGKTELTEIVRILSEINAKMISGAEAATASYEQLKAVMTETVDAAKSLGAAEERKAKQPATAKTREHYDVMKKNLQEIIRLKGKLPQAGEQETKQIKAQIKRLNERVRHHQNALKNAKAINAVRQQEVDILKEQAKIQDAINADTRKKAQLEAKEAATKKLESSYNSASKTLRSIGGHDLLVTQESAVIQKLIQDFQKYDNWLRIAKNDFSALTDTQQEEIQQSIDDFNKLTQAQKDAFKAGAYNIYNKSGKYKGELIDLSKDGSLSGLKNQVASQTMSERAALEQVAQSMILVKGATEKARLEDVQYSEATGELTAKFRDKQKNLQQLTVSFQDVGNAARISTKPIEQYQSIASKAFSAVGSKLKELLRYFSSFTIIMTVFNSIKQGIQTVTELDAALTELKVVTGNTANEMSKFQKQAQQVASAIASTTLEVTKSATEWARLGYNMADALELAEHSAIYSKIGATDINVATENLTATLQAFYSDDIRDGIISAGDAAEVIIDKLVNVGDKFASSAAGMGQGISKAGAALVAANNTLDESLALITAGTTILQNEDETASALRTISLRLRGTKSSELEAAGEDTDGAIEDISKLYKIVKEMTSVNGGKGVEIFNTDTGAYKSTYEILLEISKVWDEMTDLQQAGILETIAGKTRSNAAAAILSSSEILEEAYQASTESAGVAAEKMDIYLNSIESHIAEFKQATSVLWENTLGTDLIKGFVDLGTVIVKITDKVGLFSVALAGAFGILGAKGQGRHTNQRVSTKYA